MDYPFHAELKVRSYDMDSFGHVNNAVYFNYLEAARCEYMNQRGLSFNDFEEWGAFPFVVKADIRFKSPARADDILDVRGRIGDWRRSSFSIEYEIYNTTRNKVCARSTMVFAFVNSREKLISVPEPFRNHMDQQA